MNIFVLKNNTSGILCSSTLFSTTKIIRNDSDPFGTSFDWSKIWVSCHIDSVLAEVQCSAAIFTFSRSRDTLLQIALPKINIIQSEWMVSSRIERDESEIRNSSLLKMEFRKNFHTQNANFEFRSRAKDGHVVISCTM